MPTIIINSELYNFDPQVRVGDEITPIMRGIILDLYVSRMRVRINYFLAKNPGLSRAEIQATIFRLCDEFTWTDEPEPDLLEVEAIEIAEEIIRAKLAAQGLPPPKSLREHAEHLAGTEMVRAEARKRIIARTEATREILGASA